MKLEVTCLGFFLQVIISCVVFSDQSIWLLDLKLKLEGKFDVLRVNLRFHDRQYTFSMSFSMYLFVISQITLLSIHSVIL